LQALQAALSESNQAAVWIEQRKGRDSARARADRARAASYCNSKGIQRQAASGLLPPTLLQSAVPSRQPVLQSKIASRSLAIVQESTSNEGVTNVSIHAVLGVQHGADAALQSQRPEGNEGK
jgi:hypothetical protein